MLIIKEPSMFYSSADEDHFFQWLQSIPAVKKVTGTPKGLELAFSRSLRKAELQELIALMTRYQLSMKCLSVLCNSKNEKWFKDKKMYWYRSVFGD